MTRRIPSPGLKPLRATGLSVHGHDDERPLDAEELKRAAASARALLTMVNDPIDAAVLTAGHHLQVVANLGVGYDNVDVEFAARRGIVVTNTPNVLTHSTADLTWALILAAARRIVESDAMVRAGTWSGWKPTALLGLELRGRTLGVLGMGAIGAAVARRAGAFGMAVIYHNRSPAPEASEFGALLVSFDELLHDSDVLTLHAPLTPASLHVIGAPELRAMKRTAILVNTARGGLVDEAALISALRDGVIAGAALDVFEHEPTVPEALRAAPNTVLAPHLGSATTAARSRMVELASANIAAVLRGDPPPTAVTPPTRRSTS